jgi:glutaredoxin 2
VIRHPCGVAAEALDGAGHTYEVKVVGGFKNVPFSRRGRRDEIVSLTGQEDVPVLLLDDGTAVAGSREIVDWAGRTPATGAA